MSSAIRIHVRNTAIRTLQHGINFLEKSIGRVVDIPRPLYGITMARTQIDIQVPPVRHVIHVTHKHGAAIDFFIFLLFLIVEKLYTLQLYFTTFVFSSMLFEYLYKTIR